MGTNVIGHGTAGKTQESLLKKLVHEVFVFDPRVFPNIVIPTEVGLSLLRTLETSRSTPSKIQSLLLKISCRALITFRNKADYLIKNRELNNSEAARLVCADARMAKYGTSKFCQPYGGKLVPTCMYELINGFCRGGLNPLLFKAVRTYNLRIEKRHAST